MKAKGGRVKPTQFCFLQKDVIREWNSLLKEAPEGENVSAFQKCLCSYTNKKFKLKADSSTKAGCFPACASPWGRGFV